MDAKEIEIGDKNQYEQNPGQATHNFEDVISSMGPPGRYQIVQCLLLSLNYIPVVLINMNFVFIALEPTFSCSRVNETDFLQKSCPVTNDSSSCQISYQDCEIQTWSNASGTRQRVDSIGCHDGYTYNGGKLVSLITEWDLVCDSKGTGELSQSMLSLGWFFGFIIASMFSDKFGRKKTIAIATALFTISELGSVFAPNIYVFIALRFFSGFVAPGITGTSYVLGAEILISKNRKIFTTYIGIAWSVYAASACGIAYILRDNSWRDLQLCTSILGIIPLICIYFVDESASWLYSAGKHHQATCILKKICRTNGLDFMEVKKTWDRICHCDTKQNFKEKDAKEYNILDIFKSKKLRVYSFIVWMACFTNDTTYYGMYLSASRLAGDLYLNTTLMNLLDLPGCFVVLLMLRYKGRRFVMILFMTMAAVCLLVSTCLGQGALTSTQHIANASTAFFLLGKFAIGNSFNALVLYIPEIFPTTLRSSGLGLAGTGACIGGMLAPYANTLHGVTPWAPGACFIGILTICVILLFKLPETKGKQMPSIIYESSHPV